MSGTWGGSRHRTSLRTEAIADMSQRVAAGERLETIARDHGISRAHVSRVARGLLEPPLPTALPVWEPACMDSTDLEGWRAGRVPACEACPLGFAAEMRAIGRCNGKPQGNEEESTVPVAHLSVVSAPCESCSHAPVCRIREQVERLTSFSVVQPDDAPDLDRALTVVATATVECSMYLRARGGGPGQATESWCCPTRSELDGPSRHAR